MNYEQLKEFLTFPQLPDIISYILVIALIITIEFIKAYVKRDNKRTIIKVDEKTGKLDKLISEYEKGKKELEKERKQIRKEFRAIKEAIKQEANNTHELVANGTANKISKMLDEESQEIVEEGK